ncbi:hypothetical protein [Pseudoflavonifractor sp. MSJ-37]|uniref:hypothetical protein n=1 Tax=Pseudoflavonifractor sp. MSJ-37 TaxID=2841531 RepID=UPI001C10062E|nr:hypothetical protein [Pseudoflavonifractor sp. MSJ-37]MBU5435359.1 hypothetical protein [Pseudoflavonifractor sp. MSJ-37]
MEEKAYIKAVAGVIVGVTAAFYFGAMYGFFPFSRMTGPFGRLASAPSSSVW